MKTYRFPPGFLWGAATSSHQVEGANRWNDWWECEAAGLVPHKSGDACKHYELYESDFEMARSWGHNAHRFSVEWSRIEPREAEWSREAMEHYVDVVRALRIRGLEPIVTLHHFTNPVWFSRRGGWLHRESVRSFARYVEYVADHLAPHVRYWITVNEPTVYIKRGFLVGDWPPLRKDFRAGAALVLKRMARAHVAAYRILHRAASDIEVGFSHSAPLLVPSDPARGLDRLAVCVRDYFLHRLFFRWIGATASRKRGVKHLDFLGLNYYTRDLVRGGGWGLQAILGAKPGPERRSDAGLRSDMDWEIYPAGLRSVLERFSALGVPLLVTENGVATEDESVRAGFIEDHLRAVVEALSNGVSVIGYLYWSLMDNFEWTHGTAARFGLARVDFETQERTARPCVERFSRICRENALPLDPS
jgi:beta-glucosidase